MPRASHGRDSKQSEFERECKALTFNCIRDHFRDMNEEEVYHIKDPAIGFNVYKTIYKAKEPKMTKDANTPDTGRFLTA